MCPENFTNANIANHLPPQKKKIHLHLLENWSIAVDTKKKKTALSCKHWVVGGLNTFPTLADFRSRQETS